MCHPVKNSAPGHVVPHSINFECSDVKFTFSHTLHTLPPRSHTHKHHITTRVLSHVTEPDWCQAHQGPLPDNPWSSLGRGFCETVDGDIGNLVKSVTRVVTWMARHSATLRESKLLPPFTVACSSITLTFRAPHRRHIVWRVVPW